MTQPSFSLSRPHPWHGLSPGDDAPRVVNVFVGLQLIDRGEADDKIIAVLQGDYVWGEAQDIADVPPVLVERLEHYFSTYKLVPGEAPRIRVAGTYGYEHASAVVQAAMEDYRA